MKNSAFNKILLIFSPQMSQDYFENNKDDITNNNIKTLKLSSFITITMIFLYLIVGVVFLSNPILNNIYMIFFVIFTCHFILSLYHSSKEIKNHLFIKNLTVSFVFFMMFFTILISTFPNPSLGGQFYPLLFTSVSLVFTFAFWEISLIMTFFTIIYTFFVHTFKSPNIILSDSYTAITTYVVTLFLVALILDIRVREGNVRYKLRTLSVIDELTNLPNRRSFNQYIEDSYKHCCKHSIPMSIFMIDIDDFKMFNDKYGHLEGDHCLSKIGQGFLEFSLEHNIFIARFGGEEFISIITGKSKSEVLDIGNKIMDLMIDLNIKNEYNKVGRVTLSIGISYEETPIQTTYMDIINRADSALYEAKNAEKNQIHIHK